MALLLLSGGELLAQSSPVGNRKTEGRQTSPFRAKSFTLQDGLPDNFVNALLQDQNGFIWVGTNDGLGRFDGIDFKTFRRRPGDPYSISNNKINALLEDRQGHIWVATNGGLNRYDPSTETFRHFRHDPDDDNSISHDEVRAVFEDEAGVIWVGTFNGLNRFEPRESRFISYLHRESGALPWLAQFEQEVSAIGETSEGQLLVGYWGMGLMSFDKTRGSFQAIPPSDPSTPNLSLTVDKIVRSPKGEIWVCAAGKLFQYQASRGLETCSTVKLKNLALFTPTSSGTYMAGGDGLWILDADHQGIQHIVPQASPVDPNQNRVVTAIEDRAGDIWFGAMGGGLFHLASENKSFVNYRHRPAETSGLHDNYINALAEVEEDLVWVGSRRQGIKVFDSKNKRFKPLPSFMDYPEGLKTKEISVIYPDDDQNIWIGTWGAGLHLYRPSGQDFQYFLLDSKDTTSLSDNFVTDILQTAEGEIWVGTTLGLSVLFTGEDVENGRFKRYKYQPQIPGGLNHHRVTCIHQTRSGEIWVGTLNGLHRFDRQKETFTLYRQEPGNPRSLTGNNIKCIFEDSKERLWVGTTAGLNLLDSTGSTFRPIRAINEPENGSTIGVQEDDNGFLWVATKMGVIRLDPTGMNARFYDHRDGLHNHSFNKGAFFRSPHNGMLYAGGRNGLSIIDPDRIQDNPFVPPVCITELRKFASHEGKPVETMLKGMAGRAKIELAYWENIVTFKVAALNFRNPEKNQFAYRLLGLNDNWIDIGNKRDITFTKLDAGAYTLQVKAANNDGVWNETPAELAIIVHPPWWKSGWAYTLYGLLLFAILYGLRQYELNRQRLAFQLTTEKSEATRLKELNTLKTRLYTNLTHEFRTPLTIILGMVGQIRNDPKKHLAQGTRLIESNGKNLLSLINQLLDLSKLENHSFQLNLQQDDIISYLRYVTESFQTYANSNNLSLRFFSPMESLEMDFDPEVIKQVLTNLISNAVKFTPSGGEIVVKLFEDKSTLRIEVKDTGIGIAEEKLPSIFDRFYQVDSSHTREGEGTGIGLAHTRELVKVMGGKISVRSKTHEGSVFTIKLPITRKAPGAGSQRETDFAPLAGLPAAVPSEAQLAVGGPDTTHLPQLLIIEDNPDVVVYLKSCLEDRYELDVAYNGQIGINKALEQVPDLIISDVMMPGKDGFEVCDTLKNDQRTSHIPLILLTAKADAGSRLAGLRRGADAYLAKPFNREELLVRLDMLVERQKRMAQWFSRKSDSVSPDAQLKEAVEVEETFIQKVCAIIETHYADESFALPKLCEEIGMSRSQLFRKMTALVNTSPSGYIRSYRLQKAKEMLRATDLTIAQVAWKVGYKDPSHFSKSFQKEFGESPSAMSQASANQAGPEN